MFDFIKKLFGGKGKETSVEESTEVITTPADFVPQADPAPARTKDAKGRFISDDPRTEHNEAWVGGKSPAKKPRRPRNRKPKAATAKTNPAITEGSVRTNVKQPNPSAKKPKAPPAPKPKK